MSLSFEDGEILDLARELASFSGESLVAAIRTALEEKLGRERLLRGVDRNFAQRMEQMADPAPLDVELV